MKKIILINLLILFSMYAYSQPPHWKLGGNLAGGVDGLTLGNNFFGSAAPNNIPVHLGTFGVTRMFIQNNTGINAGFIGIGTTNPLFRLHIDGTTAGDATIFGWKKGLLLSGSSAIMWSGPSTAGLNYFMAFPSSTPSGDFFQGISNGMGPSAPVNYSIKVHVGSALFGVPQASTQIFKNLLVEEPGSMRSIGVNILVPQRSTDIFHASNPQLRLTQTQDNFTPALRVFTDFQTTSLGDLNIIPRDGATARRVGIDIGTPSHKLDINGNLRIRVVPDDVTPNFLLLGNPLATDDMEVQKLAFSGSSTDVLLGNGTWGTATSTTTANNGLSVDISGDVVLGQGCFSPGSPAKLLSNRVIPMNNFTLYFTGQGIPTADAIGLGYPSCFTMPAKFNVLEQTGTPVFVTTYTGHFRNNDFGDASTSSLFFIGVHGRSDANQLGNNTNIGGDFFGLRAPTSIGVRGQAQGVGIAPVSMGGKFTAVGSTSDVNYGVYAEANSSLLNYAVYGTVLPISGIPGTLPPSSGSYAGYFNGSVLRTGLDNFSSDATLKTNIDTIPSAMSIIGSLKPKTFFYDTTNAYGMVFSSRRQYGFLAQDVETVLPELVSSAINPGAKDTLGIEVIAPHTFKTLQYQSFTALLTKGMQEQQKTITSQQATIDELKEQVNELKSCIEGLGLCDSPSMIAPDNNSNTGDVKSKKDVELKDSQTLILDQNVPNPFAEMTTITYSLNDGVQKAQMLFYNATGKLINSLDLQATSGKGQLNVFANDLSNGIYTYTLVVDGKIVDTKRMVKNK